MLFLSNFTLQTIFPKFSQKTMDNRIACAINSPSSPLYPTKYVDCQRLFTVVFVFLKYETVSKVHVDVDMSIKCRKGQETRSKTT